MICPDYVLLTNIAALSKVNYSEHELVHLVHQLCSPTSTHNVYIPLERYCLSHVNRPFWDSGHDSMLSVIKGSPSSVFIGEFRC